MNGTVYDIEAPLPSIDEQQGKYTALSKSLQQHQQSYESTLDDLQLVCGRFVDVMKERHVHQNFKLNIRQLNKIDEDLSSGNLGAMGVSKKFMQTKSYKPKLNLANFKTITPRQLVYVTVTSRNRDKISLTFLDKEICIASSSYGVFEIIDESALFPKFLFFWLKRAEFDRYTRYYSWGSAGETFDWSHMCSVKLPNPPFAENIVTIHQTLSRRLNAELQEQLQTLCLILMREVVEKVATYKNNAVLESDS